MKKELERYFALFAVMLLAFGCVAVAESTKSEIDEFAEYLAGGEIEINLSAEDLSDWLNAAGADPRSEEYVEAARILAENGDILAQLFLGTYFECLPTPDFDGAMHWLQMAADQGNEYASNRLFELRLMLYAPACCS